MAEIGHACSVTGGAPNWKTPVSAELPVSDSRRKSSQRAAIPLRPQRHAVSRPSYPASTP